MFRFGNNKATIIDRGSALPYWVPSRNIDRLELVYTGERTPMPAITPIEEKWGHVNIDPSTRVCHQNHDKAIRV